MSTVIERSGRAIGAFVCKFEVRGVNDPSNRQTVIETVLIQNVPGGFPIATHVEHRAGHLHAVEIDADEFEVLEPGGPVRVRYVRIG